MTTAGSWSRGAIAWLIGATLAACGGGGSDAGGDGGAPGADAGPEAACLPAGARLFVKTGDPVGDSGDLFGSVGIVPVGGPEGTVAFTGYVGTDVATADRQGLFFFNGGTTIETVAVAGQAIGGGSEPAVINGRPVIARDQVVGFQIVASGSGAVETYAWNAITKDVSLLVAEGMVGAGPDNEPFKELSGFQNRAARSAFDEKLVFMSRFDAANPSPFVDIAGLWVGTIGGAPAPLALRQQQAVGFPDGIVYAPFEPEIRTDELQRAAAIVPLETQAGGISSTALYRWNLASGGAPELVHSVASPAETGVATTMSNLRMNAGGQVAFTEAGSGYPERLMAEGDGGLTTRVTVGDPAPGVAGATIARLGQIALLESGRVAFVAELSSGQRAVVRELASGLELVAVEGMELPGASGVTVETIDTAHAGDDVVVMRAFLTGGGVAQGNRAILVWNGDELAVAIRTGTTDDCQLTLDDVSILSDLIPDQEIDLFGPGQGVPRALDAGGRIPFYLSYYDQDDQYVEALGVLSTNP